MLGTRRPASWCRQPQPSARVLEVALTDLSLSYTLPVYQTALGLREDLTAGLTQLHRTGGCAARFAESLLSRHSRCVHHVFLPGWMDDPCTPGKLHDSRPKRSAQSHLLARHRADRISCSTRFADPCEDSPGGLLHTGGVLRRPTPVGGGRKGPSRPPSDPPQRCTQTPNPLRENRRAFLSSPCRLCGPAALGHPSRGDSPICAPTRPSKYKPATSKVGELASLAFTRRTGCPGEGASGG